MSVLHALYNTYNVHEAQAGEIETMTLKNGTTKTYTLLPLAHTTQTAHIEVLVTEDGAFHSAHVLDKVSTVLPFTEDSGSRAGKTFFPHGLHDKLVYVAGDYVEFTGEEDRREGFENYEKQLKSWAESPYSHADVRAIYRYVQKEQLIRDLVNEHVLYVDHNNQLLKKWTGDGDKPKIFQVIASEQAAAFVRFRVHRIEGESSVPWENRELFELYTNYYVNALQDEDICYITGERAKRTLKHPNKLRNSGDKGKLISANDDEGFTYRGRFREEKKKGVLENAAISYEASQKIHNALKWLIEKQGITLDGRVYVVWSEQHIDIPHFLAEDDIDLSEVFQLQLDVDVQQTVEDQLTEAEEQPPKAHTNETLAKKVRERLQGLRGNIKTDDLIGQNVHIVTLDAATTGRLSILSYRNFEAAQYFDRLANYQLQAGWIQTVWKDKQRYTYYQAPSLRDIAQMAYGPRAADKLVKQTVERLLPVILDQRPMPFDIVQKALARASNPYSFESTTQFEQAVEVACSIMKYHFKGEHTVTVQEQNTNRSYLFGRLLAVAEIIERNAQLEDKRTTNAMRYMNAFQMNPQRTWLTIYQNLLPYRQKLGPKGNYYERMLQDIITQFDGDGFMSNKALDGQYLLGYYSQLKAFYTKKEKVEDNEHDNITKEN